MSFASSVAGFALAPSDGTSVPGSLRPGTAAGPFLEPASLAAAGFRPGRHRLARRGRAVCAVSAGTAGVPVGARRSPVGRWDCWPTAVQPSDDAGHVDRDMPAGPRSWPACSPGTWSSIGLGCPAILDAELTSETWEKACGKLPTRRPATGSYSSESSPRSLRSRAGARRAAGVVDPGRSGRGSRPARTCRAGRRPPAGRPSTSPVVGVGSAGRSRRRRSSRSMASTVPRTRGSVGGQEADQRDHQQAGVELVRPVVLGEGPLLGVEALSQTSAWISSRSARHRSTGPSSRTLHRLDGAVEGHPGHDLGVGEVPPRAADLPDAVVGLAPAVLQEVHQRTAAGPRPGRRRGRRRPGRLVRGPTSPRRRRRAGTGPRRRCRCAPASSPRSRAASRPRTRRAGARPPAPYMICSCDGSPADGPQQPVAPGHGLLVVAAPHERSRVKVASRSQQ